MLVKSSLTALGATRRAQRGKPKLRLLRVSVQSTLESNTLGAPRSRCTTFVVFTSDGGKGGPIGPDELAVTFVINLFVEILSKEVSKSL